MILMEFACLSKMEYFSTSTSFLNQKNCSWKNHREIRDRRYDKSIHLLNTVYNIAQQNTIHSNWKKWLLRLRGDMSRKIFFAKFSKIYGNWTKTKVTRFWRSSRLSSIRDFVIFVLKKRSCTTALLWSRQLFAPQFQRFI